MQRVGGVYYVHHVREIRSSHVHGVVNLELSAPVCSLFYVYYVRIEYEMLPSGHSVERIAAEVHSFMPVLQRHFYFQESVFAVCGFVERHLVAELIVACQIVPAVAVVDVECHRKRIIAIRQASHVFHVVNVPSIAEAVKALDILIANNERVARELKLMRDFIESSQRGIIRPKS